MSSRSSRPIRTALAGLAGLAMAGAATAQQIDDSGAIVPYRPTVSNPAQLPLPGRLELELGGQRTRTADGSQASLPYLLKLAFTPEWGLLVGGDAWVRSRDAAGRASSVGDTSLIVKHAWLIDDATAFGLEAGAKLPTAKDTIGSGHADTLLNGIASRDLGAFHVDVNLNATRVGGAEAGTSRTAVGAAVAVSTELAQHWGLSAELSGSRRHGTDHAAQILTAVTYSPTPTLTWDFGVTRAPRPTPASTQWFAGVVFPLATLW